MISMPLAVFVILVILAFIGSVIVIGWLIGLILCLANLHRVKREENEEENICPYYVENENGE